MAEKNQKIALNSNNSNTVSIWVSIFYIRDLIPHYKDTFRNIKA